VTWIALLFDSCTNSLARLAIAALYLSLNQFDGDGTGVGVGGSGAGVGEGGNVGGSVGGGGGGVGSQPVSITLVPTPTTSSNNSQYPYFRRFFPHSAANNPSGASSHKAGFCKGAYGFSVRGLYGSKVRSGVRKRPVAGS
jgi:hypothetical protein